MTENRMPRRRGLCVFLPMCFFVLSVLGVASQAQPPRDAGAATTALKLKQAARESFQQADAEQARQHLAKLLDAYRAEYADNPSWRGRYQWSRQLAEVAHEYLRAGQLDDAMAILGEAADLDVPLRKGLDNGLASAAAGLHRRLTALDSDERYQRLRDWTMPTKLRRTVRILESFTPMAAPPPVFARAFGERPRDSSFAIASVGDVSGLFSSAWELVQAADETGRLRRLQTELEDLVRVGVPNANDVLTLTRIAASTRDDPALKDRLASHLVMLRDNRPVPDETPSSMDDAWQYGHGRFDEASQRTMDFTPLPYWTGAAWQMSSDRRGSGFLRIDQTGGHPSPERVCIRRWMAPRIGTLTITGTMHHPAERGDGVRGRVVSSRSGLLGEWHVRDGSLETAIGPISVEAGETIDFTVDVIGDSYYDTMVWMVQLRLVASDGAQVYDSVADFCGPNDKRVVCDAVLAAACLERDWLQPMGEGILQKLIENTYDTDVWINRPHEFNSSLIRPALRRIWAAAVLQRMNGVSADLLHDARLNDWIAAAGRGRTGTIWLAQEDHILHLAGGKDDLLFFRYPLVGDFEFTCTTQTGGRPGTDGGIGYGGLRFSVDPNDELLAVRSPTGEVLESFSQLTSRTSHFHVQYASQAEFHRFTLSSATGQLAFRSQGPPYTIADSGAESAPWITLHAAADRNPIFRSMQISGEPVIPREVPMSAGDRLRGWKDRFAQTGSRTNETTRASGGEFERLRQANANFRVPHFLSVDEILAGHIPQPPLSSELDRQDPTSRWSVKDGIIHGSHRKTQSSKSESTVVSQSWLEYSRPLLDGESVSYEFQYTPGEYAVHPTLGRLVLLIEPEGVRLHWTTDGDREWTGLAEDNAVVEPFDRRGPRPLPLVANDWNRMTIQLADGRATLSLNDQTIYEHKLQPDDDRTFGFYYDANRSGAKVRNVVMRGDWPERLTDKQRNHLAAITDPNRSQSDRFALNTLFGDKYIAGDIMETRRIAAAMSPEERYDFLADWVLPNRDHPMYRLYGEFGPTNPAPPVANYTTDEKRRLDAATRIGAGRIQTGGMAVAPALDLISVAQQLDRLDALRERVEGGAEGPTDQSHERAQLALLILIDIASQDFQAADQRLEKFSELAIEPPFRAADRWPEMLVFSAALRHRETYPLVGESVISLTEREVRHGQGTGSDLYDQHLLSLTGAKRHLDDHEAIESYLVDSPLRQWVPVSKVTAESRGRGMPIARWSAGDRSVLHYAGHASDFLYFQSPLRGNYQIDCEMTAPGGWRESSLAIGGQWTKPTWSMEYFDRGDFRNQLGTNRIDPPLWRRTDLHFLHYRVDVKNGVASTFVNGRKIREEPFDADHDPWVGIRSADHSQGGVRDLRITGSPIIPTGLRLLHDSQLTGWVPYYDETIGGEETDWRFHGNEMVGRQHDVAGGARQSLVYYHRPMVEDGSIEYEFLYEAGHTRVHPALDRLAFLLDPHGVKVHWCTDGAHDQTGLSASNSLDEPENRRGPDRLPLKLGAWNRIKLTLAGDTIELTLNGQHIYQRQLEPSNMRQFGLFHFSDRSEARVRNIVWRGDWPRELPSLAAQELADVSLLAALDAKLPEMELFEHDFAKDGMPPEVFLIPKTTLDATLAHRDDGLHLTVKETDPDRWHDHKIQHRFSLIGDFDISASFDQFKAAYPKEHKYAGVAILAYLESDPYINLWMHRRRSGSEENHHYIETTTQQPGPDGVVRWDTWKNLPNESTRGTLRLVRRGKTIHYLYAEGDSGQFRLHRTSDVSDAPIRLNGLTLFTQVGGIGETSVVWKKVTVRADRIRPNPAELISRRRETIAALTRQLTDALPVSAMEFNGSTSHVRIPTLNYDGAYPVTYEAFATPDRLNNSIIIGDTQTSGAGLAVNNGYNFHAWDGTRYQTAATYQEANRYLRVHVAATMNDGELRLFVNGKLAPYSAKLKQFVASALPICVGASPSAQEPAIDGQFTGVIDGVRITKGVRYVEDFEPPAELKADKDTVVCLRFDEGEGTRAADSSSNGHHGVISEATWVGAEALRRRAAQGLVEFGSDGVAALTEALAHENVDVQLAAIVALESAGENAKPALPALQRLAKHKDQRVRAAAEQAVAKINGTTLLKSLLNLFE